MPRIQLTFTKDEMWMYDYIKNKSSQVGWIKDQIAPAIIKEKALNGALHTLPEEVVSKYM